MPIPETEGPLFHPPRVRRDVEVIKVQEHVYFQVYWKSLGAGTGPAVILYLFGIETLKFDCMGQDRGHYHVNPNNPEQGRVEIIRLPEPTCREQIGRAMFELRANLDYYIQRNIDDRINTLRVDPRRLEDALVVVRATMIRLLDNVPELAGIR